MKVARLYSYNDIRIEEIPIPQVGRYDALIKTKACGICSGDVMQWYIEKKAPIVLGHEPSGEIVEIGQGIADSQIPVNVGDKVFVHHHAPCMECRFCKRGDYVQCLVWKGSHIIPGGISEYILVPMINLKNDTIKLPDDMEFEDGALIEPVACVIKGLKRADIKKGDTVLVIGLGVMGMINIMLAREYGAGRVIGADMVRFRLEKALQFGADDVIDVSKTDLYDGIKKATDGDMAEIVIVGPNSVQAMEAGLRCIRPGGSVLFFTPARPGERLSLDPNYIYFNDINIITSYSCGPDDTRESCRIIKKGIIKANDLVTHRFSIENTAEAFRLTATAGDSLKSLIIFE